MTGLIRVHRCVFVVYYFAVIMFIIAESGRYPVYPG
jgi:hypothetical protein